jgi:hypothetical protein
MNNLASYNSRTSFAVNSHLSPKARRKTGLHSTQRVGMATQMTGHNKLLPHVLNQIISNKQLANKHSVSQRLVRFLSKNQIPVKQGIGQKVKYIHTESSKILKQKEIQLKSY